MPRRLPGLVCGMSLALVVAAPWRVAAEPDDAHLPPVGHDAFAPRWQNVTGAPRWVHGESPRSLFSGSLRGVRLRPGESLTLRVRSGQQVRAYRPEGSLRQGDLEFRWANGTGLSVAATDVRKGVDGASLIAEAPVWGDSLVTVMRPPGAGGELRVALFVSESPDHMTAARYREPLVPERAGPRVRLDDSRGVADYWLLDRSTPLTANVTGPMRIAVRSQLPYDETDGALSQPYRIYAYLDGKLWHTQDAVTTLDTSAVRTVDGCRKLLGRPATGYLNVPAGSHRLEIHAWRPVYIRLLASVGADDFLLAQNAVAARDAAPAESGPAGTDRGFWGHSVTELQSIRAHLAQPSAATYQAAARVATDNRRRHGGLAGAMVVSGWSRAHPGEEAYEVLASRRYLFHTVYRDLVPDSLGDDGTLVYARFLTPVLSDGSADSQWLPEAYAERFADGLQGGYFFRPGRSPRTAATFLLPERGARSVLRISVDRGGIQSPGSIVLQYDDEAPREIRIDNRARVPDGLFRQSATAAALIATGQPSGAEAFAVVTGSPAHEPASLVSVAYVEVPLPEAVRQIRLWHEGNDELSTALAFRDSRPVRLSGTAYLALVNKVGAGKSVDLFRRALSRDPNASPELPGSLRAEAQRAAPETRDAYVDLYNQWVPLLRVLHSRKQRFESAVAVANGDDHSEDGSIDDQTRMDLERQAKGAVRDGRWIEALEAWSHLWHTGSGPARARARQGQLNALERLGEFFLAEQLTRYDLLHGDTATLRQAAFRRLLAAKERDGDLNGRLDLLSATVLRDPAPEPMSLLAEALLDAGRSRLALMTLLAMPEAQRPAGLVVEAAFVERWWELFERARRSLLEAREQHRWAGYRALQTGDPDGARGHWQQMGDAGKELVARLDEGLAIREDLSAADPRRRARALEKWEAWQRAASGRRIWKSLPAALSGVEETELLQVPDQDMHLRVARTGPDHAVRAAVYGPAVLRIRVRPLHINPARRAGPVNDWVSIRNGAQQQFFPIIDNRPAQGLRLLGRPGVVPGNAVDLVYEVPAGFHNLVLQTEAMPAAVELDAKRPLYPMAILPALNAYSARAVLEGPLRSGGGENAWFDWPSLTGWMNGCGDKGVELTRTADPDLATGGQGPAETPSSQWFAEAARGRRTGDAGRILWGHGSEPSSVASAATAAVLERMSGLLWTATHDAARYPSALAEAENLHLANPAVPGTQPILRRLRRSARWEQVTSLQGGAGVRVVELKGWNPESPELRLRKALMRPLLPGEQILAGHDVLAFSVDQATDSEFIVRLQMEDIGHQSPHPMTVRVGLDDEPSRHVELTPAKPSRGFKQQMGGGAHAFRLWIDEPLAGQYLRVRVLEHETRGEAPVVETHQRTFHLTTPEQSLTAYVEGPALLRVHEWRDDREVVSYLPVAGGWREVAIRAPARRREALVRVYHQTIDPERRVAAMRLPDRTTTEVPSAYWESLPPGVAQESPSDASGWTSPQDGTWSFEAGMANRRIVDDEPGERDEAERFAQAQVTFRRFAEDQETYYRWSGLIREREVGSPTLGLDGQISIQKQHWPVELDIGGSLYLQRGGEDDSMASATTLQVRVSDQRYWGAKLYHRPYLWFFKRWLTMDELPGQNPEEVDQDVFTEYKHDHRHGLKLGDTVVYRPWMDSLLYTGITLATNEDFNLLDPDHSRLRLGGKQLFGDFSVGLDYSWYHYFDDQDRDGSHDTQRLRIDLVSAGWLSPKNGWTGKLRYEFDQESGDSSVWLSLGWNRSNGRYFRDFRPGDTDFVSLRQERALKTGGGPGGQ